MIKFEDEMKTGICEIIPFVYIKDKAIRNWKYNVLINKHHLKCQWFPKAFEKC